MKKKILLFCLCLTTILILSSTFVNAASYNYNFYLNPVYSSEGLAYKDTFYLSDFMSGINKDELITNNKFMTRKNVSAFTRLSDIFVDEINNKIYILDGSQTDPTKTKITVNAKENATDDASKELEVEISSNSAVYILDGTYKLTSCFDILKITNEVKEELASHYGVSTDATRFTKAQITSSDSIEKPTRRCPFFSAKLPGTSEFVDVVTCYAASGIYVRGEYIYIADTFNSRILRVKNVAGEYIVDGVFLTPKDETFYLIGQSEEENTNKTTFLPSKIAVDSVGRVYTIASTTYEGIIEYNSNGDFNRFIGKNLVSKRSWWTFLLTDAQYETLALNNPNQFTNLVIDERDLIYATAKPDANSTVAKEMLKLINTNGKDVIKRNGYVTPDGDVKYNTYVKPAIQGPSIFCAVDVNSARICSVVDQTRGRIFTYDDEGNLLYVSGEKGTLANTMQLPVALSYYRNAVNEYVLVLDGQSNSLLVYETTEFGKLVNKATELYLNNEIEGAKDTWEDVVKMNSNYELGYIGIGKSILRDANTETNKDEQLRKYKEAMEMFELGHDKEYYSDAFKQYRNIILKDNFSLIMTGCVCLLFGAIVLTIVSKKHKRDVAKLRREEVENRE